MACDNHLLPRYGIVARAVTHTTIFQRDRTMSASKFVWDDPLRLNDQLAEDERIVRDAAYRYAQDKLLPRVTAAFRHEVSDPAIFGEMGALGLLRSTLPAGDGGAALEYVLFWLVG